jgi:hypothetical protein
MAVQKLQRPLRNLQRPGSWKQALIFFESQIVSANDLPEAGRAVIAAQTRFRLFVKGGNGPGQIVQEAVGQSVPRSQMIERVVRIEAVHFDNPLHNRIRLPVRWRVRLPVPADAVQIELSQGIAPHGGDPQIKIRRRTAVQLHFMQAGFVPTRQTGEIQIRIFHGALDLVCAPARQKDHRGMGIDALDAGRKAVGARRTQESFDFGLILRLMAAFRPGGHNRRLDRFRPQARPAAWRLRPAHRAAEADPHW